MKFSKNILIVILTVMVAAACQNPFSRPVPDALDLSFELVFGSSAARSLSAPADFAGKRLTVRLHATGSAGQPGTVLSSFTTMLQEPSSTATTVTVPVTFSAVPTRRDLIITGSLSDTDPATTTYYTATSPVFQASWTSADELALSFVKVGFPVDAKAITSFGFRKSLNPGLTQDYVATISGNTIGLVLPAGTDPAVLDTLVPTFAHTGTEVRVGVTPQVSSTNSRNFSNPAGVVYTVEATDESTYNYTVSITISGYDPLPMVVFDGNGATSGTMSNQTILTGNTAALTLNTFTRSGYTFESWNTSADGSGDFYGDAGDFFMGATSVTLYAIWTPNNYTIYFAPYGGTGTTGPQVVDYDQTVILVTNGFSLVDYVFDGWSLSAGGAVAYADGGSYTHTVVGDQTLHARWRLAGIPAAPSGLDAGLSTTGVLLSWIDNGDTETGYRVYRNGSPLPDVIGPDTTTFEDTSLTGGVSYDYYITAYSADGESAPSSTVTITYLGAFMGTGTPADVSVDLPLNINFAYTAVAGATNYHLYLSTVQNEVINWTSYAPVQSGPSASFTAGPLNPGSQYYWRLVASDGLLAQRASPVSSFTTGSSPLPVTTLGASLDAGGLLLDWTHPASGQTGYNI